MALQDALAVRDDHDNRQPDPVDRGRPAVHESEIPVLEVWEGILALPIIGSLDTAHAQSMGEALLDRIVATGADVVLLDITGVPIVDSAVAKHLLELVAAARVLGADVMIVGMSAQFAITLVHLGIDLAGVTTRTTMARGLALAFARLGLQVIAS